MRLLVASFAAAVLFPVAPAGAAVKPVWLDAHDVRKADTSRFVGPVKTTNKLKRRKPYIVQVAHVELLRYVALLGCVR